MDAIRTENLSFSYPCGRQALRGLSFSLPRGSATLLCGATGSGKSTLLRLLKPRIAPGGELSGKILFEGEPLEALGEREQVLRLGYLGQNVREGCVCARVGEEVSLVARQFDEQAAELALAEAEIAFSLREIWDRETDSLSDGTLARVELAGVAASCPCVYLLDEPTARLDPTSARAFLDALRFLCTQTGAAALIATHQTDLFAPFCDRMLFLEAGEQAFFGPMAEGLAFLRERNSPLLPAYAAFGSTPEQAREHLSRPFAFSPRESRAADGEPLLEVKHAGFSYEKGKPVWEELSLSLRAGETAALLGGNGAGKSTLLNCLAGLRRVRSGKIEKRARAALLPAQEEELFFFPSMRQCLQNLPDAYADHPLFAVLAGREDDDPATLSGGERRLFGLRLVSASGAPLWLLDEPTRGLDPSLRPLLLDLLRRHAAAGGAALCATHDPELAAELSRALLLRRGRLALDLPARTLLRRGGFLTTPLAALCLPDRRALTRDEIGGAL